MKYLFVRVWLNNGNYIEYVSISPNDGYMIFLSYSFLNINTSSLYKNISPVLKSKKYRLFEN